MSTDVLSDVLGAIRLRGAVFFCIDASSPFSAETPPSNEILPWVMPDSDHVIPYHAVTEGVCYGSIVDGEPVRLEAGDVIVFPHGDANVISSAPGLRPDLGSSEFPQPPHPRLPFMLKEGGGGPDRSYLVCGYLGVETRPFNPLLATLPRTLLFKAKGSANAEWLSRLTQCAVAESKEPRAGGECVLARLSEVMFVEVVRHYLASLQPEQKGWLAGLRDPYVGRALGLLHERPSHHWSLRELSKEVGLSRSALAERFTQFVGQPPKQYLTQWRMQVAASMLSQGTAKVSSVALETGYDSEAAFSRAFKKLVGCSPASWRYSKMKMKNQK